MKWLLTSFLKISLHCWDWMALGSEFHRLIDWYRKVRCPWEPILGLKRAIDPDLVL